MDLEEAMATKPRINALRKAPRLPSIGSANSAKKKKVAAAAAAAKLLMKEAKMSDE